MQPIVLHLIILALVAVAQNSEARVVRSDDSPDSDDELDPKVIGGRDALEGEFPYMVSLHYLKRFVCSAYLIAPKTVITAAHCVQFGDEPEDAEYYTGYVGTLDRDGPQKKVSFSKIAVPEEYGYSTEYDIAVMTLKEPLELGNGTETICLPAEDSFYENTTGQVVGWGTTEQWGFEPAEKLQTATEKIPTWELCEFTYAVLGIPVTRNHICVGGEEKKGVCFGDSGGPCVYTEDGKPVAIGVASFVSRRGCAKKYIPAVYTSVSSYLDWIKENMDKEDVPNLCVRPRKGENTPTEDTPTPPTPDGTTTGASYA